MRSIRFERIFPAMLLAAGLACVGVQAQTAKLPYNSVGTTPTKTDMGNLAWTAGPSGMDLPPGSGTAKQGRQIFLGKCSMCHGVDAQGVHWIPGKFSPIMGPRLGGGNAAPGNNSRPGKIVTIAYTSPFSEVIFNTIAVEMPMFRANTLTPDEVYALTAFVLFKNGIVREDEAMNRETLPKVKMPNRSAFPASDQMYMNMEKRGCYKTYGVCLGD